MTPWPGSGAGPVRFGRYAYPPNELGYCGPDASRQLLEQVCAGAADGDLRRLARGFDGAWPYLELIAHANSIADPLDERVVEAYWLGNALLAAVTPGTLAGSLEARFRGRAPRTWDRLVAPVALGAVAQHGFHVLSVYPWLGLLREGRLDEPLRVLDRCRVRWGQVVAVIGDRAVVRSRPLAWDGRRLSLAPPAEETVTVGVSGLTPAGPLAEGDWCSLHWDWVCERLDHTRLAALQATTRRQLDAVNGAGVPAPAVVLG